MNKFKNTIRFFLVCATFATAISSCKSDDPEEQGPTPEPFTYSNNSFKTGTSAYNGNTAPAGYEWAEIKAPYISYGLTANMSTTYSIADDFTVPKGEEWDISNLYLYAYKTNFEGENFPMSEMYLEVYSYIPSAAGSEKVYGDYTTNRYSASENYKTYRIQKDISVDLNRKIFKIKVKTEGLKLTEGTYWFKFAGKMSDNSSFYFIHNPYVAPNNYNAMSQNVTTWSKLLDNTKETSIAFDLEGKKTVK